MSKEKNLFILAGNGPYENRGCEAIVRGTVEILSRFFNLPKFIVFSNFTSNAQFLRQKSVEADTRIIHKKYIFPPRCSLNWLHERVLERFSNTGYEDYICNAIKPVLVDAKAVLAIGGDNFSIDYGLPKFFLALNSYVLRHKKPLVIWGASIGPFSRYPEYEKSVIRNLKRTIIFARESETIDYLNSLGVRENVYKVADPAYIMPSKVPDLLKLNFDLNDSYVGVNLSPLVAKYVTNGNVLLWARECVSLIELIMKRISYKILLIPHVTSAHDNDYVFLKTVYDQIGDKDRISLVPPIFDAAETKFIISKCKFFIGNRTHATIASLSSCVPTLSLGYSIKSKGIIKDYFGDLRYHCNMDTFNVSDVLDRSLEMLNDGANICAYMRNKNEIMRVSSEKSGELLAALLKVG